MDEKKEEDKRRQTQAASSIDAEKSLPRSVDPNVEKVLHNDDCTKVSEDEGSGNVIEPSVGEITSEHAAVVQSAQPEPNESSGGIEVPTREPIKAKNEHVPIDAVVVEFAEEQEPRIVIEASSGEPSDGHTALADAAQPNARESVGPVSLEKLTAARNQMLSVLLGEHRLPAAKVAEMIAVHTELVNAACADLATEIDLVSEAIKAKDSESRQVESLKIASTAESLLGFTEAIDQLYNELPKVAAVVSEGIEKRNDDSLHVVDEHIRENLTTYRQGLEIIHRMLGRSIDRKPGIAPMEVSFKELATDSKEVADAAQFSMAVNELCNAFHTVRDKNHHLIHDAKTEFEKQLSKVKSSIKQILSVVDGIDSGLQNEQENLAAIGDLSGLDEKTFQVVSSWYGAYDSLSAALDQMIANTDLTPVDTAPGKPFDTETMEPQGVVQKPEMSDDDVAVVLRRGFSFCGHLIRPALVEVVKNS